MTCDESKLLLADYWSHSLGEAEDLAFEAHIAGCERAGGKRSGWGRCGRAWR